MTLHTAALQADVVRSREKSSLLLRAARPADLAAFEGTVSETADGAVLEGPASHANALALRAAVPALRPRLVSGHRTSVGTGDRTGLATAGQARAFAEAGGGVLPVLAQQSIREMDRLGRSAREVLDDAVFGLVEAGWERGYGADCDHIKTTEGIDRGLDAGFRMFTLDPGDMVQDVTGGVTERQVDDLPWKALEDTRTDLHARYRGLDIEAAGERIAPSDAEILTAAVKYGGAVAEAARLHRHLAAHAPEAARAAHGGEPAVEVEIAVDETAWQTTFFEHHYLATELERLGVTWFSFAPRYVDGFEKGLEFRGDREELRRNLEVHHAIGALHGGYKISLHSGSDKFSIYPLALEATDGLVHLKTSGTSYLCALEVIAEEDPELFAAVWGISRQAYARAKASYQVSAHEDRTPTDLTGLGAEALVQLVRDSDDARQILHVGYGDSLTADLADGTPLRERFAADLRAHHDRYTRVLVPHISRHLAPFAAVPAR
ncbi:tagaturonate epimerase family protein [Brachybacterium subflavum]|uniref:tagaturonate epimerase family protein n=1 Tax=Brachybacterium subflavum TaxID=2585206 RepID=UPI00126631EF|nr:tagaturonate epimerase family protein [Brachybacterium subflavum]